MTITTKEMQRKLAARGYHYGNDASSNAAVGYEIGKADVTAALDTAMRQLTEANMRPVGELARAMERLNAEKHKELDALGVPDCGTVIERIRALGRERDEARTKLAECSALFEVKSLQRSLDEAKERGERETAERIAAWLRVRHGRHLSLRGADRDAFNQLLADIEAGAWKEGA